jgi:hypothetical protein
MAPSTKRIWWTSPLGATDQGDDERISNTSTIKSYTDVDEAVTGLAPPVNGAAFAFSYSQYWRLVETDSAISPFLRMKVTESVGCVDHGSIVMAEDETGQPALYWWSPQGPYRVGQMGQQFLGENVRDIGVNYLAQTRVVHGVYHADKKQVWFWVATDASDTPNMRVVFDVRKGRISNNGLVVGGWARHTGPSCEAHCSVMFSSTWGATMSKDLKPHVGITSTLGLYSCDAENSTTDNGTEYQGYVLTKPYHPWGIHARGGVVTDLTILARTPPPLSDQVLAVQVFKDFSTTVYNQVDFALDADYAGQSQIAEKTGGTGDVADAIVVQWLIGDAAAESSDWNISAVSLPVTDHGDL